MQYSFYGGQQGKNFEIAEIFDNKIQMMQDLMKRYQSQVAIGDLVLISYGIPNEDTPSYRYNADLDTKTYGHTYNATLWQKIYTEENNKETQNVTGTEIEYISKDFGLGYKLIAVLTGNTPIFTVRYNALKANQKPSVTVDNTNIDYPILTFNLPVSQILALKNTLILNANQNPKVEIDNTDIDHPKLQFSLPQSQELLPKNTSATVLNANQLPSIVFENTGTNADGTLKVNKPTLEFKLPQAQEILPKNVSTTTLDSNEEPEVVFENTGTNPDGTLKVNKPSIEFKIPQSQEILPKNVSTTVLNSDEDPEIVFENTGTNSDGSLKVNKPTIEFKIPQSQRILKENVSTTILDSSGDPEVVFDTTGSNSDGTLKINNPTVEFKLPQSQQILPDNVKTTVLDADEDPKVIFENTGTNADGTSKVNKPSLEFQLPQSQIIGLGDTTPRDADLPPALSIDNSDINNPKLNINIPKSQVIQLQPTIVVGPLEDPDIDYDETDINLPELTFSLPRAVKFMYGDRLGKRDDVIYTETLADAPEIEDLRPGDYYVHEGTGFIYLVTKESASDREFTYQACLAAPVPGVSGTAVDPYELDSSGTEYKVKDPIIQKSWSDPTELIGLILGFELPRLPDFKAEVDFVGPLEDGGVTGKPTSSTEFTYSFTVPSGAQFFGGSEVTGETSTAVVEGARPGDWYINGDKTSDSNGDIYRLDVKKTWIRIGNIKGKPGDPLNIVDKFDITSNDVEHDSLKDVSEYIENTLLGGNKPKENEIIGVTYETLGDEAQSVAYWYFVVNDRWERVQLTGAVSNLIENFYTESPEDNPITNKTYSIDYINKLIGGNITPDNADRTTFSKDQIYALFGWGTFEEAETGDWWPEIGVDKDTLSAEEILNLMSWGSMAAIDL